MESLELEWLSLCGEVSLCSLCPEIGCLWIQQIFSVPGVVRPLGLGSEQVERECFHAPFQTQEFRGNAAVQQDRDPA